MNRAPLLALVLFLLFVLYMPSSYLDRMRQNTVCALSSRKNQQPVLRFATESLEAVSLRAQVEALQEWLLNEERLRVGAQEIESLVKQSGFSFKNSLFKRRAEHFQRLLAMRYLAVPARVIFRDPSSWSCCIWVDLGERDNEILGSSIIGKNSPVMARNALVGLVDYVGEKRSRIRLITDAALSPSVRVVRGGEQNRELLYHVKSISERLALRNDLFQSEEEKERLLEILQVFSQRICPLWEEECLAKGSLCGAVSSFCRTYTGLLRGKGFNFDFSDEEGSARDLHTGNGVGLSRFCASQLVQTGDLLVTSGLDGIFPPFIPTAVVSKVYALQRGSLTYELEARPVATDLLQLREVWILPPLEWREGQSEPNASA